MTKKIQKERADHELMRVSREIVQSLTPEECKWWLLNRAFADDFPDVNAFKKDRIAAARGQELLYDQLIGDHG